MMTNRGRRNGGNSVNYRSKGRASELETVISRSEIFLARLLGMKRLSVTLVNDTAGMERGATVAKVTEGSQGEH